MTARRLLAGLCVVVTLAGAAALWKPARVALAVGGACLGALLLLGAICFLLFLLDDHTGGGEDER